MTARSFGVSESILPFLNVYEYEPLAHSSPQLRVFTLLPSPDRNADLEGLLRVEVLRNQDQEICLYEALSYVWGTQIAVSPLFMPGSTQVPITQNLAEALRYIRHPAQPRDLWIDALCIDQSNPLEKNHQVRQMYKVFALAARVIIWLGAADGDSEYALTHLQSLKAASRRDLTRIATIFQRPWSSRIWTFQEALAANADSIVMCGSTIVPWQNVLGALKDLLARAKSYPDTSIHRLRHFLEVHTLHKTSQRLTLDKLIMATSNREATDRRDYIFALLGLINDELSQDIVPDYSQSVSVTLQRAMVNIFRSHNSLDLMVYTLLARESEPFRSSWCISSTEREAFRHLSDHFLDKRFNVAFAGAANGKPMTSITHDAEKGTIKLSGAVVGMITESSWISTNRCGLDDWKDLPPGLTGGHQHWENLYYLFVQIDKITELALKKWSGVTRYRAHETINAGHVWKLIANGRRMEYILNERPVTDEIYRALYTLQSSVTKWRITEARSYKTIITAVGGMEEEPHLSGSEVHDACRGFARWLLLGNGEFNKRTLDALHSIAALACAGIKIFSTPGGYLGSCQKDVREGDFLCILFGCQVPLVLRKDNKQNHYRIIGPAYVDGIMSGEYFSNGRKRRVREFVIR